MNDEAVAQYLREHPDFLERHNELLTVLAVPHPRHEKAVSLTERQLRALRSKIQHLEQKLAELLRFGEQNDEISEKLHRLVLALFKVTGYENRRRVLFAILQDDFAVPHVALHILSDEGEGAQEIRTLAAGMGRPYCGKPAEAGTQTSLFGEMAAHIRSVALMPLRQGEQTIGLLALGSEESERFYAEMGTLYLERIGALAATALLDEPTPYRD